MRTKAFRTAGWLIVTAALALAAACTSNVIRPTELQLDVIEAALRARLLPDNLLDLKLHVFERSETSLFVAYRGTFVAPDGKRTEVYGMKIEHIRADGSPVSGWGLAGLDPRLTFDGGGSGTGMRVLPDGSLQYSIHALGTAMDRRASSIVAVTLSGKRLTTTPRNGFWYLELNDVARDDAFTSIQAQDANGKVLHAYFTP